MNSLNQIKEDLWRDVTMSSDFHPRKSTSQQPIMIDDGYHVDDMWWDDGDDDASIRKLQVAALGYFKKWHAEWAPSNSSSNPGYGHGYRRYSGSGGAALTAAKSRAEEATGGQRG